jgi:hypothetical protein
MEFRLTPTDELVCALGDLAGVRDAIARSHSASSSDFRAAERLFTRATLAVCRALQAGREAVILEEARQALDDLRRALAPLSERAVDERLLSERTAPS